MTVTLYRPSVAGTITAIPSKSEVHRLLIAAALSESSTTLLCHGTSEDIEATVASLCALGAHIERRGDTLSVTPIDRTKKASDAPPVLPVGESGSTLRFLLPVAAALCPGGVFFDMRGRLPKRPLSPLKELLEEKGISFYSPSEGRLFIKGSLPSGDYALRADVSSQFVSGLLFALPLLREKSTLTLLGRVESAPYIQMTLDTLARFSSPVRTTDGTHFDILKCPVPYSAPKGAPLAAYGDWSNAAFFLALGAIGASPVTVSGLSPDTRQGDRAVKRILSDFGAHVTEENDCVTVSPRPLRAITVDASQIPDLVPVLAVVASVATGETRFVNAARLRLKESDRIASTAAILRAVGVRVTETEDGLLVTGSGGKPHRPNAQHTQIDAAGDHRIAMCTAVLATVTEGHLTLTGAEAVKKSYPRFFEDLTSLTAHGSLTKIP